MNSQRMTSTPMLSAASSNQIALPALLCISAPCSSRTIACPSTVRNGSLFSSAVDIVSSA